MSKELNETLRLIDQTLAQESALLAELKEAVEQNGMSEVEAETVYYDFHHRFDVI